MGKKLWEISCDSTVSGETQRCRRYAIGNTEQEAIEQAKPFMPKDANLSNFNAQLIDTGNGQMFLWKVSCSYIRADYEWEKVPTMFIPGRTRDEAVMRARATQVTDAINFEAYKIEYAQGFAVGILDA